MTQATDAASTVIESAHQAAARLATIRDEVRLQIHLGELEAREAWEEDVLPQLDRAERRLKDAVERVVVEGRALDGEGRLQLHLALMEARDRWRQVEPFLRPILDEARRSGGEVLSALRRLPLGRAQLRAHLARMDAEDYVRAKRDEVEVWLRDARASALELARDTTAALRDELSVRWPDRGREAA